MNTIRSVGYGWGVLIVAGAGSYYFAKKSINSDREERAANEERRRQQYERMRAQEAVSRDIAMTSGSKTTAARTAGGAAREDHLSPSREGAGDPAPVEHAEGEGARPSRFEATQPFRSRKGDRFS